MTSGFTGRPGDGRGGINLLAKFNHLIEFYGMETPEYILETAERLFAQRGVEAVSVREIQEKAGVNVAAVHYHFGSRDDLIRAVLRRRVDPMNTQRIALLSLVETAHPAPEQLVLEDVLRAFVAPVFDLLQEAPNAAWLVAHVHTCYDDGLRKWYFNLMTPLVLRFQPAYLRTGLRFSPEEGWARMQFVWGSMIYMLFRTQRRSTIGNATLPDISPDGLREEWVSFCTAGLRSKRILS